jgi:hypothetical protein
LTRALKQLAKHTVIAMPVSVVCSVLCGILVQVVLTAVGEGGLPRQANFDAWYWPFIWGPALVLGLLVNRRTLQRAACFVWFPGLLWLASGILRIATGWHPDGVSPMTEVRIELFPRKQGECGMTECLGVLFYVWPAINSVAYSIGAAIALLSRRNKIKSDETLTDSTTLRLS